MNSSILKSVSKPGRYTGGEFGQIIKDKNQVKARWAFCFPDSYEIGLSNLGIQILYGVLNREKGSFDVAILDIHAEATSEKAAIARYFDGRISAVFGTHTHVQTADARILPNGTGFITDIGMCGPENSILGVECKAVIDKLRLHMPRRFDVAKGRISATGALFTIDSSTGRALSAEGISF